MNIVHYCNFTTINKLIKLTSTGTVAAAAPTWMALNGASEDTPFLPSPTKTKLLDISYIAK